MLFNRMIAICFSVAVVATAAAQTKEIKLKFGDVKPDDFKPQVYSIDSSADAVYLDDIGSMAYVGNTSGWFSIVFKEHEKIRLLHKNCFDNLATVKIPLYVKDDKETVSDIEATTYNLEGENVVQAKVDKGSIFHEKDGNYDIVKFTFPAVKEGSIIEYSYTKTSPYYRDVPGWSFQGSYPRLWSQYTIEKPEFFDLLVFRQGYYKPVIDTSTTTPKFYSVTVPNGAEASHNYSVSSSTVRYIWAYKNMPALKEESYITTLKDYLEQINFQFSAIRFPDEAPETFMTSWSETEEQLMKNEDFGQDLNKDNNWLKDDIKLAVNGEKDYLKKAVNIYDYVQNNYSCIDNSAVYLSQPIKKTEQSKKGNVSDINMLLIAMLRNAGFNTDPVLLSTRDHGKAYSLYPILSKFNYVVAHVYINDNEYLLDASENNLGFGHLDKDCYNGDARVIAPATKIIDLSADSLKEKEIISMILQNTDDGKIIGSYKDQMGEMQSAEMRSKMKKSNEEEFFKNEKKEFSFNVNLANQGIDSLKQNEMPVSVHYDVSFKLDDDIIYFNPLMFGQQQKENPFISAERIYPVEMPYCIDETYVMNMEVPTGYKVDELPKSTRLILNDKDGMFEYLIQQSGDNIQMRCRTKINKASFEPDDYETLRNFFATIVKKESEQIVFKKI